MEKADKVRAYRLSTSGFEYPKAFNVNVGVIVRGALVMDIRIGRFTLETGFLEKD